MIGDIAKILPGEVLLFAQREIGKHRQSHIRGRIIFFMENQENSAIITGQGLFTADAEFSQGMPLLADLVYQMIAPPAILQAVFIKLTVDGVDFTRGIFLGKQRLPEKSTEAVERPIKGVMADLKEIIRDIRSRISVASS